VSRYALDEEQTAQSEGWLDWDYLDDRAEVDGTTYAQGPDGAWHVEACGCEQELIDEEGHELAEAYRDTSCLDERPEPDDIIPDDEGDH
jgi:hypothetical protein